MKVWANSPLAGLVAVRCLLQVDCTRRKDLATQDFPNHSLFNHNGHGLTFLFVEALYLPRREFEEVR